MFPCILLFQLILYLFAYDISHDDFLISLLYSSHIALHYKNSSQASAVPSNVNKYIIIYSPFPSNLFVKLLISSFCSIIILYKFSTELIVKA
jgi:hypothetical protein